MTSFLNKYLSRTEGKTRSSATIAHLAALDHISKNNPEIANSIVQELHDQRSNLKLIASENYSSHAVQLAMGNWMTDKYAEGYPSHRFYAGCDNVDSIETMAAKELKNIFNCEHAYVQPHSGSDANLVAFWGILIHKIQNKELLSLQAKSLNELNDKEKESIRKMLVNQKIMGMSLNSGGHLSHGYLHNISSKMMRAVPYDVDPKTHLINYQKLAKQVKKEKPTILLTGYSAYPRLINFAIMREIADSANAVLMVDMAHFAGLVAGKVLTNEFDPTPYADVITSTTHKTLRGPRGGLVMCKKEYAETIDKGCPLVLGGPMPHVIAAKAIAFKEANTTSFKKYAQKVVDNAKTLAEELIKKGAHLITGGTDNHLIVINVTNFGLTGRQAEQALKLAHVTLNRNTIPFDKNTPWNTSGIRIGTAAMTTLGMCKNEMAEIADIIINVLKNTKPKIIEKTNKPSKVQFIIDQKVVQKSKIRVKQLLTKHPLYPELQT